MTMYNSLGEYERLIRKQYLSLQGHPIESHPIAFMALASSIAALDEALQEAKKSGNPKEMKSDSTGKVGIVCYPTGEIEFLEEGDERGFLTIKREGRKAKDALRETKYTEMTWEERVAFAKMEPLDMDDVLDMHRFLQGFDGDLAECATGESDNV